MGRIGLVALVLGLAVAPCLRADTLNVAGDAHTNSNQPNTNYGTLPSLGVRSSPTGAILNSYTQFDLSALPPAPSVDKAVLRLWVSAANTPGAIDVVPILDPWQEATLTAASSPAVGAPIASVAVATQDALHFVDIDITALVQDWVAGSLANTATTSTCSAASCATGAAASSSGSSRPTRAATGARCWSCCAASGLERRAGQVRRRTEALRKGFSTATPA